MAKEIKLTQGFVALVDDEDFDYLNQWKWCVVKGFSSMYASRSKYNKKRNCTKVLMHRVIMDVKGKDVIIDHKDHDGLNNQKSNLRIATASQNCSNRKSHKNSSSKYLGVNWHKPNKKWRAKISKEGIGQHIGYFDSEEIAALAYNKKAIEIHGEFANLNVINAK